MDVELTDVEGSTWTKILIVRFDGFRDHGRGMVHPKDDYELLIDRVKELLIENKIDTKRLQCVYDTKTKTKITKALWELEAHTSRDITLSLTAKFLPLVLAVSLPLLLLLVTLLSINFASHRFYTATAVLFFVFVVLVAVFTFFFKRYERRSQEDAQAILYPV
jgi:hypothetical protein